MFTKKFFFTLGVSGVVGFIVTFAAILFGGIFYSLFHGMQEEISPSLLIFYTMIAWVLWMSAFFPRNAIPKSTDARISLGLIMVMSFALYPVIPTAPETGLLMVSTLVAYQALVELFWRKREHGP